MEKNKTFKKVSDKYLFSFNGIEYKPYQIP